jgi:hypothetical protein
VIGAALALAAAAPTQLDIVGFFTGRTHADNDIKIVFHSAHKLVVDTVGRRDGNEFVQVDTVHEEGKPVRTRTWHMRELGPNHFTGTLSDATGPVDMTVSGTTATVRYVMTGGLNIFETMQLQRDGRTLSNHVEARKLGLKFAHVDGAIRKLD